MIAFSRRNAIKIAFLDSWLQNSAQGSGTAVGIAGLQRGLMQLGHQVDRLAPTGDWPRDLTWRRLLFNVHLPRLLQGHDYDLIVGFDIDGFTYAGTRDHCPYLVSIKGVLAEEARQEAGQWRWLLGLLSWLEGHNARQARGVLTTSHYCQWAICHHYNVDPSRVRIVPEGLDLPRWQRLVNEVPQQSDGYTILCVARQYRRKRIQDLLRAMVLVRQAVPQARAVIVGDGPEHEKWCQLHGDLGLGQAVQLLGAVPDDDDVARLYRQADVFCLPSVQEGFGIVFLEAMACGLPVVATTASAIPEVVPQGCAGLLVPPRDVQSLAGALIELLRAPACRAALGACGQRWVRRYDWPKVAEVFLEEIRGWL